MVMTKKKIHSVVTRTSISPNTVYQLLSVSAGRCEMCNKYLFEDGTFKVSGNFSNIAHIHAVGENGPRNAADLTEAEKNDISNLMLLCPEHHHMIDSKPDEYGTNTLLKTKQEHEQRIRILTSLSDLKSCRIVSYFVNIDVQNLETRDSSLNKAVVSQKMIPQDRPVLKLHDGLKTNYQADPVYFEECANDLCEKYKEWQTQLSETDCIAVFALAPQPLLIKLGSLLSDQRDIAVFQYHRKSNTCDFQISGKWLWPVEGVDKRVDFISLLTKNGGGQVALVVDLSAKIDDRRIIDVLGADCKIYHVTVEKPERQLVGNKNIQDDFIAAFRSMLELIKNECSEKKEIHLFPVVPQSLAVRMGMDYMPKADLPLVLYEQTHSNNGFFKTITIGG